MKYKRLTKEQFDALHEEFANFLATQQIDKREWDELKSTKPEVAEQELDVFSDLVWEGVLNSAKFLEHFSKSHIFLFHCQETFLQTIIVKSLDSQIDLMTTDGLKWLGDHMFTDSVEIHTGKKEYHSKRNESLFQLIHEGAILSDGQLYIQVNSIIQAK